MQDCDICFMSGIELYNLTATDLYYFDKIVKNEYACSIIYKICIYCKNTFNIIHKFAEKCKKSLEYSSLKQEQDTTLLVPVKPCHTLAISDINCFYVGPGFYCDIEKEEKSDTQDPTEDDLPLAELSQAEASECAEDSDNHYDQELLVSISKHKKKKKRKKTNKTKKKTVPNERFTSRMVQETDEYVVIKLTKEEVLAEMRENETSDKYKMSPYKCKQCIKGFNFEDVLNTHLEKHSPKNGPFSCDLCKQYCPSAVSLRGHIKSHTTRYRCKMCGMVRVSRQHILDHYSLQHTAAATAYQCTHCPYTSNMRTVMQRHVRVHVRSEPQHACKHCGKLYSTRDTLRVHTIKCHDRGRQEALACGACSRRFAHAAQLRRHERTHERRDHYCVECDLHFKSICTLRQHFKRAKIHRDTASYKFECESCSQRFASAATLGTHARAAHGAAPTASCVRCARAYTSAEALRMHVSRAHRTTPAPRADCDACGKTFSRPSVLRAHRLRVHGEDADARGASKLKDSKIKNGNEES